ncbi:Asp23/Gls24 family envelope stress response protein [Blastococcus sp. TBT05-19]|uniref:Asp23/Gls24 family envelope stress response protein n=1 Tax=Blastococcus sp. TBT05-19 TaxID=2250581 RepID=UPI000DEBE07B|nr:Asp23/Gls24 family envelope stress response protein [Blastococcus sp. TBT05-19]RBY91664.1 Asp23/Gls24 family envelope stress response protein [Blastococcus sp. TBT05-19]
MSTAVSAAEPDAATDDPGERGTLTLADRVVERVAGYAATQVPGAAAAPRRVLGISVGDARPDSEASVRARVDGGTATVEATIAVSWPASVRAVTEQLRERVRADVLRVTGVRVAHIDVDVVSFAVPESRPRRVQ